MRPLCLAILLIAAGPALQAETLKGFLVDMVCARSPTDRLNLGPEHTRKCLLMPACKAGGYGILTANDVVIPFDEKGNAQAEKLLSSTTQEADFRITANGKRRGDHFEVSRISLEKLTQQKK